MSFRVIIPNVLTAANLLSGFVSVLLLFWGNIEYSFYAILMAAVFDLLDGLIARLLKGQSEFGKQFDSMADLVSFGFAPSLMLLFTSFLFMQNRLEQSIVSVLPAAIFLLAVAVRLAWFNSDSSQDTDFKGLASPAAAIALSSLIIKYDAFWGDHRILFFWTSITFAILMLVPVRVMSLKFTKSRTHLVFAIFIALSAIILFILDGIFSLWIIIILYYITGILMYYLDRVFKKN